MNVNRLNERKWFHTKKRQKNRQYPDETITDADYADGLTLLASTSVKAESQLYRLEQAERGMGFYVMEPNLR